MAFPKLSARTPASVGQIQIVLVDRVANPNTVPPQVASQTIMYRVEILDASGALLSIESGDLLAHLTATQSNSAKNLLTAIRNKATAEFI